MALSSAIHPDWVVLLAVTSLQRNLASGAGALGSRVKHGLGPGDTERYFRGNPLSRVWSMT